MNFEDFEKFITEYYPEDCYDDDIIRDFYNKGFYSWNTDEVLSTLGELTDKLDKNPILEMLIVELKFKHSQK